MLDSTKRENIVFHFNKHHLVDPNVPMWVIKHKGNTYYVHHLDMSSGVGFSTKETPDSDHTKGSLKFKGRLKITNDNNMIIATIT